MEKQQTKKNTKKKTTTKVNTKKDIKVVKIETGNKPVKEITQDKVLPKKHNGIISFWKFMFCLMIVVFHGKLFANSSKNAILIGGSIGVEFFFIVSGYLMAKTALKKKDDTNESIGSETLKYIWKKYKSFIPYTIVTGIIGLILYNMYNHPGIIKNLSSIHDMFLIRMTGIKCLAINIPTWYISSMLICMLILYPLIRKYKENFIYIVAPLIVLLGIGYLLHEYKHLRGPGIWIGLTYKGNIRALAELSLGCIVYLLSEKLKLIKFTKFGKLFITLAEIGSFVLIFLISHFMQSGIKYDGILLFIITVGITIAFSEQTLEYNLLCNKFSYWLERLSLTMYMIHWSVRFFFINFEPLKNLKYSIKLPAYTLSAIVLGIILMYIMDFLKKKNYFIPKFKKLIVKEKIEA